MTTSVINRPEINTPTIQGTIQSAVEIFQPIVINEWVRKCPQITANHLCGDLVSLFRQNTDLECVVVCDELHRPMGLVMKHRFFRLLGSLFGMSLYGHKPISELMDVKPLVASINIDPQEIIDIALARDEATFYDAVLMIDGRGILAGVMRVNDLLNISRLIQRKAVDQQMRTIRDTELMIGEIHRSVAKVSETSLHTQACSERITEITEHGRNELEGMLQLFKLWSENAAAQERAISQLTERTAAADGIIRLIADLADQCNLLAVNATIEAARAGEHGKGFGVVASEIHSLADQTKHSAKQITGMLRSMSEAVKSAESSVLQGKQGADQGFVQVKHAEDTFAQLWSSSELNNDAAALLIKASNEAKGITNEISKEIHKLSNQLKK